jgi:DNA repair exonuclease SbcCD ATPase subunit
MNETDKRVIKGITTASIKAAASVAADIPGPASETRFSERPENGAVAAAPMASGVLRLQALILVPGLLIAAYLIFALHQLMGAHSLFEAAQLQRILNQRYAKEILLASSGVPVNYDKTSKEWARSLTVLTHGGEMSLEAEPQGLRVRPPADASRFRASLEHMSQMRQKIVRQSTEFMDANRLSQHREQLFDELYRQSLELQAAGDALVQTYDRHLNSGVSWWDVNAVAVELAERQRMLIQQHVKEVLFVAHGIPADYQATRLRLYETTRILAEGGSIEVDGGDAIAVPAPTNADVVFNLEQQKTALERFTAVSNQFLMLANEDVERSIQLKTLSDLTSEFHVAATALLNEYRGFFSGRVGRATRDAVIAAILAAAFALLLIWSYAKKFVDGPAARLTEALRSLRLGRKPERQGEGEGGSGPLAEAAREFDRCSDAWRSRREWLDGLLTTEDPASLTDPGDQDPVAARLYRWCKDRASSEPAPRSRWSSQDDPSDNDITIVGRLPEAEPSLPIVQDSELLDQLILRANELQTQNDRLTRAQSALESEAQALKDSQAAGREAHDRLLTENSRLNVQVNGLAAELDALRGQSAELEVLRGQLSALGAAESALKADTNGILRLNAELVERLSRQGEELAVLRNKLAEAESAIEQLLRDSGRASESAASELAAARQQITGLLDRASEAERSAAELRSELDRRDERIHLEGERREGLLAQIKALQTDLELMSGVHREALERQAALLDAERHEKEVLGREKDALERDRRALEQDKSAAEQDRDSRGRELADQEARHRALEQEHTRLLQEKVALADERTALSRSLADLRADLETAAVERAAEAARLERSAAELQGSLQLQTRTIEDLRIELSRTLTQHAAEIALKNSALQAADQNLQNCEAELWQSRKVLSDLQRDLGASRLEVQSLIQSRDAQLLLVETLRGGLSDLEARLESKTAALQSATEVCRELEQKIDQSIRRHSEDRQRLESEMAALKAAYFEKCQALASAEDRLSATRAALKTTLEELQERSKP